MSKAILAAVLPWFGVAGLPACAVDLDRAGGTLVVEVRGVDARFRTVQLNVDGDDVSFSRDLAVRPQQVRLAVIAGPLRVQLAGWDASGALVGTVEGDVNVVPGTEAIIRLDLVGGQTQHRVRFTATEVLIGMRMSGELVASSSTAIHLGAEVRDARVALGSVRLVGFERVACRVRGDEEGDIRDLMSPPVHLEFVGERVGTRRLATWNALERDPVKKRFRLSPEALGPLQEDLQEGRFRWALRGTSRGSSSEETIAITVDYYAVQ